MIGGYLGRIFDHPFGKGVGRKRLDVAPYKARNSGTEQIGSDESPPWASITAGP